MTKFRTLLPGLLLALCCAPAALLAQAGTPDVGEATIEAPAAAAAAAESTADLPALDEVIAAYLENTGGEDAWLALKTMRSTAKMSMGPMEFSGTVTGAVPNKQRIDIDVQGQQLVQAYDGTTAWQINPFAGGTEPQPMSAEEAEMFTKQEFQSPFIDLAGKGHSAAVTGTKEVEGVETIEVTLTKKSGDVEKYYFEPEYMVPIMQSQEVTSGPMKGQVAETYLSDYQEVGGLMMPHFVETKMGGQTLQKITLSEIETNPEIDPAVFAMPAGK